MNNSPHETSAPDDAPAREPNSAVPPAASSSTTIKGEVHLNNQAGGNAIGVRIDSQNNYGPVNFITPDADPQAEKRWFRVPAPNRVFTGRESELKQIHDALRPGSRATAALPCALWGMAGVGKSQIAIAYIQRHGSEYDRIFWLVAVSPEQLATSLAGLADDLQLPVPAQSPPNVLLDAVQTWFGTHGNWLLVIDNAENLPRLKPLFPQHPTGRILLTTRESIPASLANCVVITHLADQTGALLLLRRAGVLTPEQPLDAANTMIQADAVAVSLEVNGLPLALDQAGAYIETLGISPADYLQAYRQDRQTLDSEYDTTDHLSVTVTFRLALKQVEQIPDIGTAAAELVRMCAFLAPDAIPQEIFLQGAAALNAELAAFAKDKIAFARVGSAASRYALVRRDADPPGFTMHRLAQEVLRDSLPPDTQKQMAEQVTRAVYLAFPVLDYPARSLCARLLSHALRCAEYVTAYAYRTPETSLLLSRTATYLQYRARYPEAKKLFRQALAIDRETLGDKHPNVAAALNNLAALYQQTGDSAAAIPLYLEALEIARATLGDAHPDYATGLDNLAQAHLAQRDFVSAAALRTQALDISRRTQNVDRAAVVYRLNNLAIVYIDIGNDNAAEPLLQEARTLGRETLAPDDPAYASLSVNLGVIYTKQGRFAEAEPLLQEALAVTENALGGEHPAVASCQFKLGFLSYRQGRYAEAAQSFRESLAIRERFLGPNHPDTLATRGALARTEQKQAAGS